jgi:hypothetical protein
MGSGLTIEGATLPVALLLNHCEQSMVVTAQTLAALTQSWTVELQIVAAQKHTKNIHALIEITDGQRQPQPQHICGSGLRFHLTLQSGVEKADGKKRLG